MAYEHAKLNVVACNVADTDLMLSAFSSANFSTVLQDLLEENCQLQVRGDHESERNPFRLRYLLGKLDCVQNMFYFFDE